MKTITVSRARFIEELAMMAENYGSTDWAIYVRDDGCVQARHDAYSNAEGFKYHKVLPAYNLNDIADNNDRYHNELGFNNWEVAEWIVDECIWDQHGDKEIFLEMV